MFRQCCNIVFFHFSIGLWNCPDNVVLFVFLWDIGTVPTAMHYFFSYGTLELFRQCGIICFSFFYWTLELFRQCCHIDLHFSIGLWNCSDSVALLFFLLDVGTFFIFLLDFGTIPTVCNIFFSVLYGTLEMFWQCDIIGFSILLCNCSESVACLFSYWTLDLFRQCGIICFSIGLWTCSDSVALFVFLRDFGPVPTVWHYWFSYWTLELFRQRGIICFSIGL